MVTISNNGEISCDKSSYCTAKYGSFCIDCPLTKIFKNKKECISETLPPSYLITETKYDRI